MAKRKVGQSEELDITFETVETTSHSQPFWEKYQKQIIYALGAILALVALWFGYKKAIVEPQQKEAVGAMWQAQMQFERDSFKQALENPGGGFDGFLSIIDKYGNTPAGNTAKYYAAVCYMQTNDLDNAIKYMEDYSEEGDLLPIMKYGVLGDLYSEKKEFDKAAGMYEKAVNAGNNELLSSMYLRKLGLLHDMQGNKEAANKAFERLRLEFPNLNSQEWRDAEKYIYKNGGEKE